MSDSPADFERTPGGAILMDGDRLRDETVATIRRTIEAAGSPPVCLATVLVGDDPPSQIYVRNKHKRAQEAGMVSRQVQLPATASQAEVEDAVAELADDDAVHGILCQLPLPDGLDPDDLDAAKGFDGYGAYARSKLANVLFSSAMARRTKTTHNALHPGVITTKLLKSGFGMSGAGVETGQKTSVMVATDPALEGVTGKYFSDEREVTPSKLARDTELAERLYADRTAPLRRLPGHRRRLLPGMERLRRRPSSRLLRFQTSVGEGVMTYGGWYNFAIGFEVSVDGWCGRRSSDESGAGPGATRTSFGSSPKPMRPRSAWRRWRGGMISVRSSSMPGGGCSGTPQQRRLRRHRWSFCRWR